MNVRLRAAMLRAGLSAADLAQSTRVDTKTITRWIDGRVPHRRNRLTVAAALGETESSLWPSARPDQVPGSPATGEVLSAYAHRSDITHDTWVGLLDGAREQVDLLGYAYPFMFELSSRIPDLLARRCAAGARVRIALADPECAHVAERDALEQLDGTLPGRIRNSLNFIRDLAGIEGVTVGPHTVHLYNSVFRFDAQMITTPHLYRVRGYQHPALHLRRLSPFGIFESFADQFEQIWATVRPLGGDFT